MTLQKQFAELMKLSEKMEFSELVRKATPLALEYPSSFEIWSILAAGHKALGQLDGAENCFRKAVNINPSYAEGFYMLGIVLNERGKFDKAISAYQQAVALKPEIAEFYNSIGNALKDQGKLNDAILAYERALILKPEFAEAHYNTGNILRDLGKLEDAIAAYQRSLTFKPDLAEAFYNIGLTFAQLGKLDQAIGAYKRVVALKPDNAEAYNNMGNALKEVGKFDEAISAYQRALSVNPVYAEAYNNTGNALNDQGKFDDAIAAYQRALDIKPTYAEAYYNMGNALKDHGKLNEAIVSYQRALTLKPAYAETYYNMGIALQDQGKLDETFLAYTRALEIKPAYAGVQYALGQLHLAKLNFMTGFRLCEWRWKTDQNIGEVLVSSKPKWHGQKGKVVFLWSEQGIGDEIMFSSVIPDLSICCSTLIVRCDERLIPIFKRSFSQNVYFVSKSELVPESDYDFQIAMGSALGYLRTGLESFKNSSMPYLKCHTQKSDFLRNSILNLGFNRIIGISWSTKSSKRSARYRNVSLEQLAISAFQTGTALINLQYGDVSQQISQLQENLGLSVIQISEIDNRNDIDGLGALIAACDQVVSVDNATVHLAGALGVDTKVLLPFNPDWRWGIKKSTSYWYNSLKLYHQNLPGEWDDVLVQIRKDLCSTDDRNI